MSSVYLFLSLTYKNLNDIWEFIYSKKFEQHRYAFCRLASITMIDLIAEGNKLIDQYIDQFEEKLPPVKSIIIRLAKLRRINRTKHSFIDEWEDIVKATRQYKDLVRKLGIRRARRYLMSNRINKLLDDVNMNERVKGYIINKIDGREDKQLMNKIDDIYHIIQLEFGL